MEHLLGGVARPLPTGDWRQRWRARLALWRARRRERLLLEGLLREASERLLVDIGIDPARARVEARKPFWVA